MFEFVTARELFELVQVGSEIEKDQLEYVELDGWVRTNRNNGSVGFIELNDGTYFKNVQLVYNKGDESYVPSRLSRIRQRCAMRRLQNIRTPGN